MDRPQRPQNTQDQPGTSYQTNERAHYESLPMEEGEIGSDTDQDPSVLVAPAINWDQYVGVKSVKYIKMGHAPKVDAEKPKN